MNRKKREFLPAVVFADRFIIVNAYPPPRLELGVTHKLNLSTPGGFTGDANFTPEKLNRSVTNDLFKCNSEAFYYF